MLVTPTASSQFLAGVGFWSIVWSSLMKLQKIAKFIKCDNFVNQDKVLHWINDNKAIALIGSEVINMGLHSPDSAAGATFCLGGTVMNVIMIFFVLPVRCGVKKMFSQTF